MPRAQRSGWVRTALVALVIMGVFTVGVGWHYHAVMGDIEEGEAQQARRRERAEANAASTAPKVNRSRPRPGASLSTSTTGSTSELVDRLEREAAPGAARSVAAAEPDLPWSHPGMCVGAAGTRGDQ